MKKMRRMAALLLSCVLVAACPGIGSRAEEDTRGDFVFGDYDEGKLRFIVLWAH